MGVTDRHNMTLGVKAALNPNTTNQRFVTEEQGGQPYSFVYIPLFMLTSLISSSILAV